MTSRVDRILEVLDHAGQVAGDASYGTDAFPELCWRCQRTKPLEDSKAGVCGACRAHLLAEVEPEPRVEVKGGAVAGIIRAHIVAVEFEADVAHLRVIFEVDEDRLAEIRASIARLAEVTALSVAQARDAIVNALNSLELTLPELTGLEGIAATARRPVEVALERSRTATRRAVDEGRRRPRHADPHARAPRRIDPPPERNFNRRRP